MNDLSQQKIDASCRVPLLALFGGAALWLVVGLALSIIASLTFHAVRKRSKADIAIAVRDSK